MDLWTIENEILDAGTSPVCGVDEAGRGPLAGPVCAAAVILPRGLLIPGLDDSKKLSPRRRDALFDAICAQAVSFGVAFATVEEIERLNILGATYLAMNRAARPRMCARADRREPERRDRGAEPLRDRRGRKVRLHRRGEHPRKGHP